MSEKYTFHEPMPDCVPEYYCNHQEDEGHRQKLLMQAQSHYLANREKIDAAAASKLPILQFWRLWTMQELPDRRPQHHDRHGRRP